MSKDTMGRDWTAEAVSRVEIETLLAAGARGWRPPAAMPGTMLDFAVCLIAETGGKVTPIYDTDDHLVEFSGIALKEGARRRLRDSRS